MFEVTGTLGTNSTPSLKCMLSDCYHISLPSCHVAAQEVRSLSTSMLGLAISLSLAILMLSFLDRVRVGVLDSDLELGLLRSTCPGISVCLVTH